MRTLPDMIRELDRRDCGVSILDDDSLLDYASLRAAILGNVRHFRGLGVRAGDTVALSMETDLEHIVSALALMALGAIPMSVKPPRSSDPAQVREEMRPFFERHRPRFSVGALLSHPSAPALRWDPEARDSDSGLVETPAPSDTAFVQFSSGSQSDPKAVPIRHESLVSNIDTILSVDRRSPGSSGSCVLPLSHDMGWVGFLSSLSVQSHARMISTARFLRKPMPFLEGLGKCAALGLPDFLLRYISRRLRENRRPIGPILAGLSTIYCGAEPIRRETIAAFLDAAMPYGLDPSSLVFCYGMAEATLIVSAHRFASLSESFVTASHGRVLARVGRPIGGAELRIGELVHDRFVPAPRGEEAPIWVRGPSVFKGYLGHHPLGTDGWHETGDVGFFEGDALCISGREKELIIVNGENLFPADIESFIATMPGVSDTVVLPDEDSFLVMIVGSRANVEATELSERVAARFGVRPAEVVHAAPSDVLRTTSGKPRRRAMLEQLRQRS